MVASSIVPDRVKPYAVVVDRSGQDLARSSGGVPRFAPSFDQERQRRLQQEARSSDVLDAVRDAGEYRALDLPVIDTTARTPGEVAAELVEVISQLEQL